MAGAAPAAGGAAPAAAAEVSLTLNHYGGLHGGIQLKTQSDFMGIFCSITRIVPCSGPQEGREEGGVRGGRR